MEATMVNNNTDEDHEVGGLMEKVPHLITALIAVGSLVAAYFMTIGDFKLKDLELQQRVVYLEDKVNSIEKNIEIIKNKLETRVPIVDADRENLHKEIEGLREILQQMKTFKK